jgi:hypothetical protein
MGGPTTSGSSSIMMAPWRLRCAFVGLGYPIVGDRKSASTALLFTRLFYVFALQHLLLFLGWNS